MGAVEQTILKQAKQAGEPIPERIRNKPRLNPTLAFYLEAHAELDTDRDVAFGFGPIPWSSLNAYAQAYGMTGEDYEDFMFLVRYVDNAYIKHMQSKGNNGAQST